MCERMQFLKKLSVIDLQQSFQSIGDGEKEPNAERPATEGGMAKGNRSARLAGQPEFCVPRLEHQTRDGEKRLLRGKSTKMENKSRARARCPLPASESLAN